MKKLLASVINMKRAMLCFVSLFTSLSLFAQSHTPHSKPSSYIPLYDSIKTWSGDTAELGWDVHASQKYINFTYDAHGNTLTKTFETDPNNTGWMKDNMAINTYDLHNNMLTDSAKVWNGSAWVSNSLFIYTYDARNNKLSDTSESWNGSAWLNVYLYTWTYDADNNMLTETYQTWSGSAWVNASLNIYAYDAHNNMLSDTAKYWSSAWVNNYLYTYTYNVSNNQLSQTYQTWQASAWTNSTLFKFTYNVKNNLSMDSVYNWSAGWIINALNTYTYDANSNLLTLLGETWNGSAWVKSNLNTYIYGANNIQLVYTYRQYFSGGPQFNGDSTYYYIKSELQGINQMAAGSGQFLVYPNPSKGVFTIQLAGMLSGAETSVNMQVYNVLGEQVYFNHQIIKSSNYQINLTSQPNGVYFYRVVAEDGGIIGEGKVVVER